MILVFHIIEPGVDIATDRWGYSLKQFTQIANLVESKKNERLLDVVTVQESLKIEGSSLPLKERKGAVSIDNNGSDGIIALSPKIKTSTAKEAFFLKVFINASDLVGSGKFKVEVKETLNNGETRFVPLVESEKSNFLFAQTYIPTSLSVRSFQIITQFTDTMAGVFNWDNLELIRRRPSLDAQE